MRLGAPSGGRCACTGISSLLSLLGQLSTAIVETLLILTPRASFPLWTIGDTITNLCLFQTSYCILTQELRLRAGFCCVQPLLGFFNSLQYGGGGWGVIGDVSTVYVHVDLTFPCLCVPSHISPALTLSLASRGEVGVADEVHVHSQAGGGGGAVLEWLEVGGSWRWSLVLWVATTHALGEARVALAESKLAVGVGRTSIHAPVPVIVVVAEAHVIAASIAPHVHHPLVLVIPLVNTGSCHPAGNPKSCSSKKSCSNSKSQRLLGDAFALILANSTWK